MVPGACTRNRPAIPIEIYWFRISDKEQGFLSPPFLHFRLPVSLDSYMQIKGSAPLSLLPILCTAYISFHVFFSVCKELVRWFLSVSDRFSFILSDDSFSTFSMYPSHTWRLTTFTWSLLPVHWFWVRTILTLFPSLLYSRYPSRFVVLYFRI